MRPPALALLALLLAGPALAQDAQLPSLSVLAQPEYTPGDLWVYRVTLLGENRTSFSQDQTVRVVELGAFNGTPAIRLFTFTEQEVPGDDQSGSLYITSNRTTWISQQGHKILRIEELVDRTQWTSFFRVLTRTWVNWSFHEPMDLYQYPILVEDAWVVVTNATLERSITIFSHAKGNEPAQVNQTPQSADVFQTSATAWVRQDVCSVDNNCSLAGAFDGVVLVSRSGNATIRDFWAPAAGNLVRREILNETGALVETSLLTQFNYQKAPDLSPRPRPSNPVRDVVEIFVFSQPWLPIVWAAGLGILGALIAIFVWERAHRSRGPAARETPEAPSESPPTTPSSTEPPGEPPAPPEPSAPSEEAPPAPLDDRQDRPPPDS